MQSVESNFFFFRTDALHIFMLVANLSLLISLSATMEEEMSVDISHRKMDEFN